MLVGRSPALDELERRLGQPALCAANFFDAIGELAVAPVGQPISAVLVSADLARSARGRAVSALRRVDPSVVVALVADTPQQLDDMPEDGFDARLVAPIDDEALAQLAAVGVAASLVAGLPATQAPAQPAPDDRASGVPAPPPEPPPEPQPLPEPEAVRPPAPPRLQMLRALGEAPAPAPPPTRAAGDLGDTDLVEAALHDPIGVLETALELARQQSGVDDLSFVDATLPSREGDGPAAEVRYGQCRHGWLCSHRADARQLRPWAEWLGRWLALDRAYREFRLLSYRDDLTGAWNRRFFHAFLAETIELAGRRREPVTLMVFDIDDFKRYNDEYGHEAGDVILVETVRLLKSVIRQGDRVCRIGGDEFAVIFADPEGPRELGSRHPQSVEQIAKRFQDQISTMRFPKLGIDAPGRLSISGGLATYPWDGADPEALLRHTDRLALQSKRSGKNVITLGPEGADDAG
jgi:diguanylate cyclase (GGDEF)-like protein